MTNTAPRRPMKAEVEKFGFSWPTVVFPVLTLGLCLFVSIFRPVKWFEVVFAEVVHVVSLAAFACLLLAALSHVFALAHKHSSAGPHQTVPGRRAVVRRWLAAGGLAGLAVGGEISGHFAAMNIHEHVENRFPGYRQVYANHDIAKLVGHTIEVMALKVRDAKDITGGFMLPDEERAKVRAIAGVVAEEWSKLAQPDEEHTIPADPRIIPLTEKELWKVIQNPGAPMLDDGRWSPLLDEWSEAANVERLAPGARALVIGELTANFSFALREALKHDYMHGGKGYAAMQLDMFGELLRRTSDADTTIAEIKTALAKLDELPQLIKDLELQVRAQQDEYSRLVVGRFNEIRRLLRDIAEDVRAAREAAEKAAMGTDTITKMLVVFADPSLSEREKFQRVLDLAGQDEPKEIQLPTDIREFVKRLAANATLIDKHRAAVLLNDLVGADRLAEQYERERDSQRAEEDYAFAVTRGDRYFLDKVYDDAAHYYGEALNIREDDLKVVNRFAFSIIAFPSAPDYEQRLSEAEDLLRRTLGLANSYDLIEGDNRQTKILIGIRECVERRGYSAEVAQALNNLATVRWRLGHGDFESLLLYEKAIDVALRVLPPDDPARKLYTANFVRLISEGACPPQAIAETP